jgi:hypothetical protein
MIAWNDPLHGVDPQIANEQSAGQRLNHRL